MTLTLPNVDTFLLLWADTSSRQLPAVESHELECLSDLFPNPLAGSTDEILGGPVGSRSPLRYQHYI